MLYKFLDDKRGNLAITSAIALVPMFAAVSAAVDYSQISRHSSNMQQALDAAALATGKKLGTLEANDDLESYSKKFFFANLKGIETNNVSFAYSAESGDGGSSIRLEARYEYPMLFGGLLNNSTYRLDIESVVRSGNRSVEIALVLDNSGSMRDERLTAAKSAARSLVTQVHASMAASNIANPVKFSLVPFAGMVNVGANNANKDWIDTTGASPTHNENLDWSDYPGATNEGDGRWSDASGNWLTRFTLFDDLNVDWKGCVEARPYPYMVTDAAADVDDPETLFVPVFAPDEPDNYSGEEDNEDNNDDEGDDDGHDNDDDEGDDDGHDNDDDEGDDDGHDNDDDEGDDDGHGDDEGNDDGHGGHGGGDDGHDNNDDEGDDDGHDNDDDEGDDDGHDNDDDEGDDGEDDGEDSASIEEEDYYNNYLDDWNEDSAPSGKSKYDAAHVGTGSKQFKRAKWTWKYDGQSVETDSVFKGPNAGCTTNPISPLTTNAATIKSAIDDMEAVGSTNIPLAVSWGWKVLSSGAPFSEGRAAGAANNTKIMVIMTDGNNTYYKPSTLEDVSDYTKSIYGAYGYTRSSTYSSKGRLFEAYDAEANPTHDNATFTAAMDEHLIETCTNAKAAGINIYTVAFDVADGSSVKDKLQACASVNPKTGTKQYYDVSGANQLVSAFTSIGSNISALRLAR